MVATIFLPLSFLASVWGFTNTSLTSLQYVWAAIPVLVISCLAVFVVPWATRRFQTVLYPVEQIRIHLQPRTFTMLGDELPENVDIPGSTRRRSKLNRHKAQRPAGMDGARSRSRSRFRRQDMED